MPAPLAKGIILLSSILFAAGLAAYENPEVRAWFEERRRKIALTLNEIADEFDSNRPSRRRTSSTFDASTTEDNSMEATERRRRARQEIIERGIALDRRRKSEQERRATASSFDDMVDSGGKLKEEPDSEAVTTSIAPDAGSRTIRARTNQASIIAAGSALANPFGDELGEVIHDKAVMEQESLVSRERSTTSTGKEDLQLDTGAVMAGPISQNDEQLLTPTTSVAASTLLSASGIMTPTSTHYRQTDMEEPISAAAAATQEPTQSYQSIQEWASAAASSGPASFYSPPESDRNFPNIASKTVQTPSRASSMTASIIGTSDLASHDGDADIDMLSDAGVATPSAWSEIGSQISGDN